MSWIAVAMVSFFGAALSALGMGGGGILLIYLTAYAGMRQQMAQGINLAFFIPVGAVALILHAKHGLIRWKTALPCVLVGLPGVWLGARLALWMDSDLLGKVFGGFLLVVGVREMLARPKDKGDG